REPGRVVRSEEDGDVGDVIGLADATEGSLTDDRCWKIRSDKSGGVRALGFDHAGVDRVDADLLCTKLPREHTGDRVDGALCAGVDGAVRRRDACDARTYVDDARSFAEILDRRLRDEQKPEHVDIEHAVELILCYLFDGCELVNA